MEGASDRASRGSASINSTQQPKQVSIPPVLASGAMAGNRDSEGSGSYTTVSSNSGSPSGSDEGEKVVAGMHSGAPSAQQRRPTQKKQQQQKSTS